VQGREDGHGDPVGVVAVDLAAVHRPGDQRGRRGERAVVRGPQFREIRVVLAGEHQGQQGRVLDGEADVAPREGGQPLVEAAGHLAEPSVEFGAKALKALHREGVEKRALVREMGPGSAVADAEFPGEFPQGQASHPNLLDLVPGRVQQRRAQVAVVVRRVSHSHGEIVGDAYILDTD